MSAALQDTLPSDAAPSFEQFQVICASSQLLDVRVHGACCAAQVLKLTGNSPELALPFAALATMPSLRELHVDRDVRRRMTRDLAAAPLLHWLHF